MPELPDVPTVKEFGIKELKDFTYQHLHGPVRPGQDAA